MSTSQPPGAIPICTIHGRSLFTRTWPGGISTQVCPVCENPRSGAGVNASSDGASMCAAGYHAWMPWLLLDAQRRWVTWCVRCRHEEHYELAEGLEQA